MSPRKRASWLPSLLPTAAALAGGRGPPGTGGGGGGRHPRPAPPNRGRAAVANRHAFIVLVGATGDLDAVELLSTSLLVQADLAMARQGSRSTVGGVSRTRSFRQSFLTAYASRIGERLREASDATACAGGHLPVLRSQEERVAEEFDRLVPHTRGRAASVSNGEGWRAGRVAADLAQLDAHRGLNSG